MEFCHSIAEADIARAKELILTLPLVELRADLMGLSAPQVAELVGVARRAIVTCHSDNSKEIYLAAIEAGVWAVDMELESPEEFLTELILKAHARGTKVILSHHHSSTPSLQELIAEAQRALNLGADIAKIITTATSTAEGLAPLELYKHFAPQSLIAFAMGLHGAFSRRASLLLGAPYTYVALDREHTTAVGQPTAEELSLALTSGHSLEGIALPASLTPPSSKSEAQRAILAAALAKGTSVIHRLHACEDTEAAIALAESLGAECTLSGTKLTVVGRGAREIAQQLGSTIQSLNVGESALLCRLTIPIVATLLQRGSVEIVGRGSLLARSQKESIQTIEHFGAEVRHTGYTLPLTITHGCTLPTEIELEGGDSSQTISGVMMAAPLIDRDEMTHLQVLGAVSRRYLSLTADIMEQFGCYLTVGEEEPMAIDIEPELYQPSEVWLNADWSSAGYFAAAYAIAQSGHLQAERYTIKGKIGTWQGDEVLLMLLSIAGANIAIGKSTVEFLPSGGLSAITYDATHTPDLIPTLAIVALFAKGESVIGGLHRLANKESNRTESLVENLVAIGGDVWIDGDRLHIVGGHTLRPAPILTHGDHRIAMAFAVAALFMEQRPTLDNIHCVAKSFPRFFGLLNNKTK